MNYLEQITNKTARSKRRIKLFGNKYAAIGVEKDIIMLRSKHSGVKIQINLNK